jgi:hypothetical protein
VLLLVGTWIPYGSAQTVTADGAKARQAIAILQDPGRTPMEHADAIKVLHSLGPAGLKSIEPVVFRILQNAAPSLDSADFLVYAIAKELLSKLVPDRSSIPVLVELIRKNPFLSFEASYALGNLGGEARSAVPALVKALGSDDPDEVEVVTFVLARIAPDPAAEAAAPALIETLKGEKGWVGRFNAAVALLKLGREQEKSRAVIRNAPFELLLPLDDKQPLNRLHLCEALTFYGPPQRDLLDLLRKIAAEDSDARVREAAAKALQKVAADARVSNPVNGSAKALSALPPELTAAGEAVIESERALDSGDMETYKKHLGSASRKEFDRNPKIAFDVAQHYNRLPGLRLLGGTLEGNSATIDVFSAGAGFYQEGTMTMTKTAGRWVRTAVVVHYASVKDEPNNDALPPWLKERAALEVLTAIAASQIDHWNRSTPASYAESLAELPVPQLLSGQKDGYAFTMAAGARSNGIDHAWFAEAHPVRYKETGIHSYYVDERGIILRSDTRGKPLLLELPAH